MPHIMHGRRRRHETRACPLSSPRPLPNSSDYRRRGHPRRRLVSIRQRQRFLACPFHPRLARRHCSHGAGQQIRSVQLAIPKVLLTFLRTSRRWLPEWLVYLYPHS
jgi:hypothetical protein